MQLWKTSQIVAISLHAAFLLPSVSVWLCASWKKIKSHCPQTIHMFSIPFLPTLHHTPMCLLCYLCSNSVFSQCWWCQARGLSLPACTGPWPLLHCLFYGCRGVMLSVPLLCVFILTLHAWLADSSTSALVCPGVVVVSSHIALRFGVVLIRLPTDTFYSLFPMLPARACCCSGWKLWMQ